MQERQHLLRQQLLPHPNLACRLLLRRWRFCVSRPAEGPFARTAVLRPCCASGPGQLPDVPPPWALTFDLRERETVWTDQNKTRLVQLVAGDRLEISRQELEKRIRELSILLPDLVSRYPSMQPDLLAKILKSIDRVALTIIELKEAFPKTDISAMLARSPSILLEEVPAVVKKAEKTKELLEVEELDGLIAEHPLFLDPSAVEEVLTDLQRLMPGNSKSHLLRNPSLLLSTVKGQKRLGDNPDI